MTDQSPAVSRAFMSRLREVLTARLPAGPGWVVWVDGVVEELADVTPAQDIDRDALLAAIRECAPAGMELRYDGTEDKYAAAYVAGVAAYVAGVQAAHDAAERILARGRPVEGIVLSPEEARVAADALSAWNEAGHVVSRAVDVASLASRLEVS